LSIKIIIDFYFILIYNSVKGGDYMKLIKYISLTHTPSTHIVCLPVKMVRELDLLKDNTVQIKLDDDKIIITKVKE
jgi:hypothetical protein